MKIPQSVRDEIAKGPLAHLTTLNKDGSPQVTVIWVGIEGEEFVIGHLALHQKIKNIRRDPRVALSFIGQNTSKEGMREYVVAYGRARITEGGAVPLLPRLGDDYVHQLFPGGKEGVAGGAVAGPLRSGLSSFMTSSATRRWSSTRS